MSQQMNDRLLLGPNSRSQYAQQLKIFGFDREGRFKETRTEVERKRMDEIVLAPLNLSERSKVQGRPFYRTWAPALAIAAMLALALWPFIKTERPEEIYSMKGDSQISIYFRDGESVLKWDGVQPLPEKVPIRVDVLSSFDGIGYLTFFSKTGDLLSSLEELLARKKALAAGERDAFPGSFQLTGVSQGETLGIVLCDPEGSQILEELPQAQVAELIGQTVRTGGGELVLREGRCQVNVKLLRK